MTYNSRKGPVLHIRALSLPLFAFCLHTYLSIKGENAIQIHFKNKNVTKPFVLQESFCLTESKHRTTSLYGFRFA